MFKHEIMSHYFNFGGQGGLQLRVEAGPVGLGEVGEDEAHSVDVVRKPVRAAVICLEDDVNHHLRHVAGLVRQSHQLHTGDVKTV